MVFFSPFAVLHCFFTSPPADARDSTSSTAFMFYFILTNTSLPTKKKAKNIWREKYHRLQWLTWELQQELQRQMLSITLIKFLLACVLGQVSLCERLWCYSSSSMESYCINQSCTKWSLFVEVNLLPVTSHVTFSTCASVIVFISAFHLVNGLFQYLVYSTRLF